MLIAAAGRFVGLDDDGGFSLSTSSTFVTPPVKSQQPLQLHRWDQAGACNPKLHISPIAYVNAWARRDQFGHLSPGDRAHNVPVPQMVPVESRWER
jgi:hypothetical protein